LRAAGWFECALCEAPVLLKPKLEFWQVSQIVKAIESRVE